MRKFLTLNILAILFLPHPVFAGHEEDHPLPKSLERKYEQRAPEIKKLDLNEDGILQSEEIQAGIQSKFDAMDINKDGVVSADEQRGAASNFKKDKGETYGKFIDKRARKLENRMKNADANEDGVISSGEYETYFGARYQNMDKDGDGTLNVKEFRTDTERVRKRKKK